MNKVILIGRLTKDPELRKTPTDVSVCQFTIAVNRAFQQQNGERQADFINCIAWRNQAENLAKYIKKGGQVAVDGSIQTRSYDDQNGVRRFATEVICNQITFLESKRTDSGYSDLSQLEVPPMRESNSFSQESPFGDIKSNFDISSDDLPF
jgi:single-strand DNA-binding protein